MKGEEYSRQQHSAAIKDIVFVPHHIHEYGAIVGNDHFLEESPQHLPHAIVEFLGEAHLARKLVYHSPGTFNWTGNELWKE